MDDNPQARQRYSRATALVDDALDLPVAERDAYVMAHSGDDAALRAEVRSLLLAHASLGGFLEASVLPDALIARLQDSIGDRYRLVSRIASGGMATVYRADDLRHARPVAIKVFALDTVSGSGGVATAERFLDEIRVTARLQHPNIMPLFDSGAANGLLYYVMPFVGGESLRAYLQRTGALSVDQALGIARGIANGLEHAHASGIVHRDLKPENILLRDGQPLICDFGIALATATLDAVRATESGTIVGTPQYMSPEQAVGSAQLDARTDVYALGAMLYEMLVGDPPFSASTPQRILAKVLSEAPTAVSVLQPTVSVAMSDVIARAMQRQAPDRYPSARAMHDALIAAAVAPPVIAASTVPVAAAIPSTGRGSARYVAAATVLAGIAVVAWMARPHEAAPVMPAARFAVAPIPDAAIGRAPTLTPDGAALVYAGAAELGRKVFVRRVNELEARALDGTHGALATAVSPDGRRIAFTTSDDRLVRIGVDGSDMTDLGSVFRYTNTTWLTDSAIVFDSPGERGLSLVSASGGAARVITQIDSARHDTAHLLPLAVSDGRFIVFTVLRNRSGPSVQVGELCVVRVRDADRAPAAYTALHIMARGAFAYVDGWLLYVRADARALMAIRFDPERGEVTGEPVPVLEQEGGGIDKVTFARNGTLLYSRFVLPSNAPVIVDSSGAATPIRAGLSGAFMNPRVSRDGRRIIVQRVTTQGSDAWLYDLDNGTERRVTTVGTALSPAWGADDHGIVYLSSQDGRDALWATPVDGDGPAHRIVASPGAFAASPSHDANVLLFQRRVDGPWSIWRADIAAGSARPVLQAAHDAFMPTLSPDGKWLAWAASETGKYEVYLRPFPEPGTTVQVSVDGGTEPAWAPDGHTIFYRADRRMMAATISATEPRAVTRRRQLFTDTFDGDMPMPHRNYDVMPDGRRFVMIAPTQSRAPETIVVLNWLAEFQNKVAAAPH